jgi:Putative Flp pilus-assembly TadE/G-like
MMLIFAGLGLVAFMSASMLALDVGMFMVARTQAQAAADAGALAGATALYYDDWDDRSATGAAVQNAIKAATADANAVMSQPVSVIPEDVTFPAVDKVRVRVLRTAARGNPLLPFIAPMFGITEVDMGAEATAHAAPATAMTCVKPFTIPDKWEERYPPADEFNVVDKSGQPLVNPDVYVASGPGTTGWDPFLDRGVEVVIKAGQGSQIAPSYYYPYAMGEGEGADWYRENIEGCNRDIMERGDLLRAEPGNMSGPTKQGVEDLIAQDPTARWDGQRVVSSMHPSPRVVTIPVFDPMYYHTGKMNSSNADLKVADFIGIFIERMDGNDVIGRIVPVPGIYDGSGGSVPTDSFPAAIVLVK